MECKIIAEESNYIKIYDTPSLKRVSGERFQTK
jgi:hypothetical protein